MLRCKSDTEIDPLIFKLVIWIQIILASKLVIMSALNG